MRIAVLLSEMLMAAFLFFDGINRLVVPVQAAPVSVPWLAGFVYLAQGVMYALGGLELLGCAGLLLFSVRDLTEMAPTMHPPHHGAHP